MVIQYAAFFDLYYRDDEILFSQLVKPGLCEDSREISVLVLIRRIILRSV